MQPVSVSESYCCHRWPATVLQVCGAAAPLADDVTPQHGAAAAGTGALHWQQVGGFRLEEELGQADHVTVGLTGRMQAGDLVCPLQDEARTAVLMVQFGDRTSKGSTNF